MGENDRTDALVRRARRPRRCSHRSLGPPRIAPRGERRACLPNAALDTPRGPRVPPGPPPRARGSGPRRPRRRRPPRIERATRRRRVHLLLVRLLLLVRAGGDARAPPGGTAEVVIRYAYPGVRFSQAKVVIARVPAGAPGRSKHPRDHAESSQRESDPNRVARVRRRHRRAGFGGDRGGRRGRAAMARARRAGPRAGHLGHPQVAGAGARRGGGGG